MKDNGVVCSAFWRHANLRGDDRIFPCCRFKTPAGTFTGSLVKILSSEEYKKLREQSTAGIPIDGLKNVIMKKVWAKKVYVNNLTKSIIEILLN